MTMQNNIDTVRRHIRRNMDKSKFQIFAAKIDNQRPVRVPIAVSAHNGQRRADCIEVERDCWFANITKVPDLVGLVGKIDNLLRQFVVGVSYDQDAYCIHFKTAAGANNADITSAPRKIIRLNPLNPRLVLPCVIQ